MIMEIKYRGEDVDVVYKTYGKYYPATQYEPAEYPEYDITAVFYKDVDILPLLSYADIEEIYDELQYSIDPTE